MLSIILVSYNEGRYTAACVDSIKRHVTVPVEIIVVDNASKPETVAILESLERITLIKLIKNKENRGFPAACNTGLAHAKGDTIWFLNNDTLVPRGSLERMLELLQSDTSIGAVGPVSNRISGRQEIPVDYEVSLPANHPDHDPTESLNTINDFAQKNAAENSGKTWRMIRLVGFSILIRRSTLEETGGFDERMGIGTFEDDVLSLRLIAKGYRLLVARDAFIHHFGNVSFRAAGGYPPTGERNQRIASRGAGMTIPDETVLNDDFLTLLRRDSKRILHVECGAGAYGLFARDSGCYVEALESNPRKAQIAKNHYNRLTTYTPGKSFVFDGNGFDAVMIEKQTDSVSAFMIITSILPSLVPGAQILVEIPKITAINGFVFDTYFDGWTPEKHFPIRGKFDVIGFITKLDACGLLLEHYELLPVRKGFFNRNSFERHLESAAAESGGLNFFKCARFVFIYNGGTHNGREALA